MVDMRFLFAIIAAMGSLSAATYLNYSNVTNITGFDKALDYTSSATATATGYADAFGILVLGVIFFGFYVVGSRYTQERALVYATFMTTIAAFILTSGGFLDPVWLMLSIFGLLAAVYFASRIG